MTKIQRKSANLSKKKLLTEATEEFNKPQIISVGGTIAIGKAISAREAISKGKAEFDRVVHEVSIIYRKKFQNELYQMDNRLGSREVVTFVSSRIRRRTKTIKIKDRTNNKIGENPRILYGKDDFNQYSSKTTDHISISLITSDSDRLDRMLAQCDLTSPLSDERKEWLNISPIGKEKIK